MTLTVAATRTSELRFLVAVMMFFSGAAALIYQIAWQRLLSLSYGVGPVSTAIVVSVFMFGLGIGSFLAGRYAGRGTFSVFTYLIVEIAIGLFGLASLPLLGAIGRATAGADLWLVAVASFGFLCIPTMLMGATLPIVISIIPRFEDNLLSDLGFFYFINTLGAAAGSLFGSFIAITWLGLDGAILVAALINVGLGIVMVILARRGGSEQLVPPSVGRRVEINENDRESRFIFPLIFLAGFVAISYQIIWFRLASVLLKDSPYAFSAGLGVYLLGLALGSRWIQTRDATSQESKRTLFYTLNVLVALSAVALVAVLAMLNSQAWFRSIIGGVSRQMVIPVVPGMAGNPTAVEAAWSFAAIFVWPALLMLVPTFLMGASFPLATSLLRHPSSATSVGTSYFVAVIGNTLGALITSFFLLPYFGTIATMAFFVALGLLFVLRLEGHGSGPKVLRGASVIAALGLLVCLHTPDRALYGPLHAEFGTTSEEAFSEGVEGVVLARRVGSVIYNYINGSSHGAYPGAGYYNAAFAALAAVPKAQTVLVIGYGAGSIVGATLNETTGARVRLVEVNGTLLRNFGKLREQGDMLRHPRLEVVVEDARRDLLRSARRYDVIMMDPLRSTSQFSNNIYSLEFLRLVADRLNPGGVLMIWTDNVTVLPRTVAEAFPYVEFYRNRCSIMLASRQPVQIDRALHARLAESVPESFRTSIFESPCLEESEGRDAIIARTASVPINRDVKPVAEYYLRGYR